MTIKDWLEAGKPKSESFTIRRDFEVPKAKEEIEAYFRTMAHLIIENAKFYCDNNFKIEPLNLMFFDDTAYKYEFDGFQFTAIFSNGTISVGAKVVAL